MVTHGGARLLFIDGFVNLLLGVALLCFDPVAAVLFVILWGLASILVLISLVELKIRA